MISSLPFFEAGPKAIIWGEAMLALAKVIDKTAMKYDVDVIVPPQYTDIKLLADNTGRILVFAQHMDALVPGRGLGSVLPEAVKAAGYYLAVKSICDERGYDTISLKDVDGMKKLLGFPPTPIFMLLSDEAGLCTVPENGGLGSITQMMVKYLTGQCAAYLEFYEFFEDSVLAGVPDYVPAEVVDGDVTVMPAAFGELSEGILNVSRVKTGLLTMCRLTCIDGVYYMHMVTGEGKTPMKWEEAGWTQPAPQLPGLRVYLDNVPDFAEKVMCQHYIISYGDNTELIQNLCDILGIEVI